MRYSLCLLKIVEFLHVVGGDSGQIHQKPYDDYLAQRDNQGRIVEK